MFPMLTRLLAVVLLAGSPSAVGQMTTLVVLDKDETVSLTVGNHAETTAAAIDDPVKARFLEQLTATLAGRPAFGPPRAMVNPPEWGRTVSAETTGKLRHLSSFSGGFVCNLTLEHLAPGHRYILTLNGRPDLPGNDLLPDPVPGLPKERYYDFVTIETDSNGTYSGTLAVRLPQGGYEVRLYVKDPDDFKIVLYHDYFPFSVR
jgi:hypothetical protein